MRPLALSVGCPAGIGPEVAIAALAEPPACGVLLVGDPRTLQAEALLRGIALPIREPEEIGAGEIGVYAQSATLACPVKPGKPDRAAGAAQLAWIDQACDLVAAGRCAALVTGPVSKEAIAGSGAPGSARFRGHTEHLAGRLHAGEPVMAFFLAGARDLGCALATTHLPLAKVPRAITPGRVAGACSSLARLLRELGAKRPAIAVCGLNPHAGEHGLIGREEIDAIVPGIAFARRRTRGQGNVRSRFEGPMGAETAFRRARAGDFDGVVAMYHDQATIALKLLGFGEAVNATLGLPIIRTSVDHGTAYDIAGKGVASPAGMRAAIALAERLAATRQGGPSAPANRS